MRNLKRALSLVLAAAMLVSLMVVGASAASYGDQDAVNQTEAVDVLTGLGIVGGDQNGNYNPDATLTRAEFCVMIANTLNRSNFDPTLFDGTETPFTDVANHWGANYIAYCYSAGIIAGTSATTFSPDATLTAAQAAAILLSALGYNQANEFAANGQFSLNVTRWAQTAGLYDNLSVAANAGISRENTAKMIFNALTVATPVEYNQAFGIYNTVGNGLNGVVRGDDGISTHYNLTLANKNFGLQHTTKDGTPVTFGQTDTSTTSTYRMLVATGRYVTVDANQIDREGYVWYMENDNDDYVAVSDVVYTDTVLATVSNGKGLNHWTVKGDNDYVAEVSGTWNDGTTRYIINNHSKVASSTTTYGDVTTLDDKTGVTFTFVDNTADGKADLVYVDNRTVATITGAVTTKTEGGKTLISVPGVLGYGNNVESKDVIGYEGLAKDDVVLWYKDGQTNQYIIEKAETVTGNLTSIKGGDYTVAGTAYKASGLVTNAFASIGNGNLNKQVQIWLDNSGYVVKAVEVEDGTLPYALVLEYDVPTIAGQMTKLLTADGQTLVGNAQYKSNGNDLDMVANGATSGQVNVTEGQTIVHYELKDGVYELTAVSPATTTDEGTIANPTQVKKGTTNLGNSVVADANTVFVLLDAKNKASTYTGIANVPTVDSDTYMAAVGIGSASSYVASVVFVTGAATKVDAADVIYVFDTNASVSKDGTTTLYTYQVVKNGAITTETFSTNVSGVISAAGAYEVTSRDAKGYGTVANVASGAYTFSATGAQAQSLTNNTLIYGGNSIQVNDATKIFVVNATTKAITEGSLADIIATTIEGQSYSKVAVAAAVENGNKTGVAANIFVVGDATIGAVATPTTVTLATGDTNGATVKVGKTDLKAAAGEVQYWSVGDNENIKITVTPAASTEVAGMTINGADYAEGSDYKLTAAGTLSIVVTMRDTSTLATKAFEYTVTVPAATVIAAPTAVTLAAGDSNGVTTVSSTNLLEGNGQVTAWSDSNKTIKVNVTAATGTTLTSVKVNEDSSNKKDADIDLSTIDGLNAGGTVTIKVTITDDTTSLDRVFEYTIEVSAKS